MTNNIEDVFRFVSQHSDCRAELGVIVSSDKDAFPLAWAAVDKKRGEAVWVPALDETRQSSPGAYWAPIRPSKQPPSEANTKPKFEKRKRWLLP